VGDARRQRSGRREARRANHLIASRAHFAVAGVERLDVRRQERVLALGGIRQSIHFVRDGPQFGGGEAGQALTVSPVSNPPDLLCQPS
jgi:hypothetical protein